MEETMRTLRPPARRRSGLLSWIAAAFVALPLAFLIVVGVFTAQENMTAGETKLASVSARAALARAQRGLPPTGAPAARNLAAAATPSFFDFAAGAVYRTLCPLFGTCNIAKTPSTNPATSFSNVKSAESIPPIAPNGATTASPLAVSNEFPTPSNESPNRAMAAAASYSETNSQNVKSAEFISPIAPNGAMTAAASAVSNFPAAPTRAVSNEIPASWASASAPDSRSLALLGAALAQLYDQKLAALDTTLRQVIFQNVSAPLSLPASGGTVNNIALSQRIDNLSGTAITNPTITGGSINGAAISGSSLSISGDASLGAATTTSLAVTGSGTSTFTNGINIADGCFAVDGACLSASGSGTPTGSDTEVQFNNGSSLGASSAFTFSSSTETLSVTNAISTNGTTTNATSTTIFANFGHFATAIIDTIANITTTELVATNATTTSLFVKSSLVAPNATIGSLTATSTLAVFGASSFGGTATSSFDAAGNLTIPATAKLTAPYASTTAITVASLWGSAFASCSGSNDKLLYNASTGQFSCGNDLTGGSGGTDVNLTFFNGSALRPSTTTNQVLIGGTSTTTLAKFEVQGGAKLDYASTTALTVTNSLYAPVISSLLSTDENGKLVATSTISTSLLAASSIALATGSSGSDINVTGSPASLGGTLTLNVPSASGSARGLLTSSDWTTFNSKQAPLVSGTNIKTVNGTTLLGSGDLVLTAASSTLLADANTWTNTQTFSAAPILSTLSGLLKGNGASALTAAAAGTDYAPPTSGTSVLLGNGSGGFSSYAGTSCTNQFVRSVNGAGVATCASISLTADVTGTLGYGNGGTGTTTAPSSWLLYGGGNGVYQAVSTSSIAVGSGISVTSGTLGYQVGGANVTLGIASGAISNSMLANSTIALSTGSTGSDINVTGSPASLGGTLTLNIPSASGSNRGLLTSSDWTTFNNKVSSSRSISAGTGLSGGGDLSADRTLSLNLGNANTWTALQQFGNASTTALTVSGSAYFPGSGVWTSTGNVGIGTTSPSRQLTLTEDIELPMSGNSTQGVIYKRGYTYQIEGAIQYGENVRFLHDYRPLSPFPTDGANTFLGSLAGNFTMAPDAGAIGNYSIHTAYNTGVGASALVSLTTGYNNAGFGVAALRYNTEGYSNTAAGRDALHNNTVGTYNVAVGQSALYGGEINADSSGSFNTAIGALALWNATTAASNVAVGYNAGRGSSPDERTVVDSFMVFLGRDASRSSDTASTTALTNGIAIGYDAKVLASNQAVLGNDSITTTLLKGNVGIGTTTPDTNLVVGLPSGSGGFKLVDSDGQLLMYARDGSSGSTGNGLLSVYGDGNAETIRLYGFSSGVSYFNGGNVGVGTTSPWRKFSVTGTVGFDGLTAGAGAGALCLSANKEVTYSAGAGCTGSSQRFKHDIAPLDASTSLDEVLRLNPVSFVYNDDIGVKGPQVGLIAEQVQQIDPRLVATDASGTPFTVKYENLTAILAAAIQNLFAQLTDLSNTVASFAERVVTKELVAVNVTGNTGTFNTLCVKKSDATPVCVTGDQLSALLSQSAASGFANPTPTTGTPPIDTDLANPTPDPAEPPIIEIQGNNPAHLNVGDTYIDLGARITGPTQADTNLGIKTFLNGALVSNIVLDTSLPATDTIDYVATNAAGTSTSTRTVIVKAAQGQAPSPPPAISPATTTATSTPAQ